MNKYQTFFKRLLAILIDALVFFPYIIFDAPEGYLFWWELGYILLWTGYSVIAHGRFGQTIGKYLLGIRVVYIDDEQSLIGYRRAFVRELTWFLVSIFVLAAFLNYEGASIAGLALNYDDISGIAGLVYVVAQVIIVFSNEKRRGFHDYLAGSVVVINLR